jgi:predicted esterase
MTTESDTATTRQPTGPHQGQPVLAGGAPLHQAWSAVLLVHGRGATAHDIMTLAAELPCEACAYLAPQAANNSWYPYAFLEPMERNEPYLSSALARLGQVFETIGEAGVPPERILIVGFSQGACLASEYVARNARRYGGLAALSGGLIGPDGTPRDYAGSLEGTLVFLGCSDIDPHIPKQRVQHTADVLGALGAEVTMRLYPGLGHTVNADEMKIVRGMLEKLGS